jgi:tRNA nucleotidyltransferase (CCA-adding enzyme)
MADYLYSLEIRLTPEQQAGVRLVQEAARTHALNLYLTGGAIRDIISGLPIRDLDFTVQGNPFKLQKDLEKAGAMTHGADEELHSLHMLLPGNVRAEISMARLEKYEKPGKPPVVSPGTITDDLRRRDFTVNAMALSLNEGSRGLLLDPANGVADIEAKLIRILHNYAFLEEPSRLIRATRFATRFHWAMEERTQARYDAAKENDYIDYISDRARGYEIEALAYEEDPVPVVKALEKEGWLKVLQPRWTVAKVDTAGLSQMMKMRQQMAESGFAADTAPIVLYFLTRRLGGTDTAALQRLLPRRDLVERWRRLEDEARQLSKRLGSKEGATPSRAWQLLSQSSPQTILFLSLTVRQQAARNKIRNFFGKWRQLKHKLPLPEMAELRITPELPVYPQLMEQAFHLLLDGKLRSHNEIVKFLKPFAPPPPPPPPVPPRKKKGAEAAGKGKAAAPPPRKQPAKAAPKPKSKPAPEAMAKAKPKSRPKPKAKKPARKPARKTARGSKHGKKK